MTSAGVTDRLPHVARLGADAVWLTPVYASPMRDFGYDISDHCAIDPSFGTLEDFDALVERAHALGLKVILDFVPNHTSDLHPWFVESRSSRESPKRDWYLWRDGNPPNNWISVFGGRAWTWDEATGQSYYHAYLAEQPDLNWRNPEVREAMFAVLRFWIARGVDGFRVDAMRQVLKDLSLRDNPADAGLGRAAGRLRRAAAPVHDRPRRGAGGRRRDPRARSATSGCSWPR